MSDKPLSIHIDSSTQREDIPKHGPDKCPDCDIPVESGFGLAGGGYGVYTYCPNCGMMTSKVQIDD